MNPNAVMITNRRRLAAVAAAAVMLSGLGLAGCSLANAVKKVTSTVTSDRAAINAFTGKLQAGQATTFAATYVTTGSSPTTIVYAVQPPKNLAFTESPTGTVNGIGKVDIVANASGEYYCTPLSVASTSWTCQKQNAVTAAERSKVFSFYTPAHWVAFLQNFSLVAGLVGKVTSSTMTVNGFHMSCINFRATNIPGTSTICTTSQNILGYVKVATVATSFELKSYTTSPPASLFRLPPGAKVHAGSGSGGAG
jgi:hypothetical protein